MAAPPRGIGDTVKYITEMELRQLYKDRPFSQYLLPVAAKLTPGAKQFLVDRRIPAVPVEAQDQTGRSATASASRRLLRRLEHTEAKLLLAACHLSHLDARTLADEVAALARQLRQLRKAVMEERSPDPIFFWGADAGELKRQADTAASDPAWLTMVGVGGETEILLHYVRTAMGDLEPFIWELQEENRGRQDFWDCLADRLQSMLGIVCIMICKCREVRNEKHELSL